MRTDSACPVVPVLTCSYVAVSADPPAYPATTPVTPFTCSKTSCIPQKQPPESTAVACPALLALGASSAGAGSDADAALAPRIPLPTRRTTATTVAPSAAPLRASIRAMDILRLGGGRARRHRSGDICTLRTHQLAVQFRASELQLPRLPDQPVAEVSVRHFVHESKSGALVDAPRLVQHVVRPQCDRAVARLAREAHALVHETRAEPQPARLGLH